MLEAQLPSIHDLLPLEQGGPIARAGFFYQDHIGARDLEFVWGDLRPADPEEQAGEPH